MISTKDSGEKRYSIIRLLSRAQKAEKMPRLSNTEVVYVPPDTTSELQPCDLVVVVPPNL